MFLVLLLVGVVLAGSVEVFEGIDKLGHYLAESRDPDELVARIAYTNSKLDNISFEEWEEATSFVPHLTVKDCCYGIVDYTGDLLAYRLYVKRWSIGETVLSVEQVGHQCRFDMKKYVEGLKRDIIVEFDSDEYKALPDELLPLIFDNVENKELLLTLKLVNRQFNRVISKLIDERVTTNDRSFLRDVYQCHLYPKARPPPQSDTTIIINPYTDRRSFEWEQMERAVRNGRCGLFRTIILTPPILLCIATALYFGIVGVFEEALLDGVFAVFMLVGSLVCASCLGGSEVSDMRRVPCKRLLCDCSSDD